MEIKIAKDVDEYISWFPAETQVKLQEIRKIIKTTAPLAVEGISYKMPAYNYKGVLVYFAAYKSHIGFYATPSGGIAFAKELSKYNTGKGSIQFPLDEKLPIALIKKIVTFRIKENEEKAAKKK